MSTRGRDSASPPRRAARGPGGDNPRARRRAAAGRQWRCALEGGRGAGPGCQAVSAPLPGRARRSETLAPPQSGAAPATGIWGRRERARVKGGGGGEEGRGGEGITWRNARIISSATEGGRTHCSSSARRRREAARAGVSDSSPKPAGCEEAALRRGGERWAPGRRGAQGITPTHAGLAPRDQVAGKMPIARRSLKGRGGPGTVSRS